MRYPGKLSFLAARRGLVPRLAGTAFDALYEAGRPDDARDLISYKGPALGKTDRFVLVFRKV